jgi:hypothetical protein
VDTSSLLENLTSTAAKADGAEGVMDLMRGGKCLHDRVTLSLLRNVRNDLKFAPVRIYERTLLAYLIEADKEK